MKRLVKQLAERLKMESFDADARGNYHLSIGGYSVQLELLGAHLVVRSPLEHMLNKDASINLDVMCHALRMAASWARYCPQALTLSPEGEPVLEARMDMHWRDVDVLERLLCAQVGVLELLQPNRLKANAGPKWSPTIWRP